MTRQKLASTTALPALLSLIGLLGSSTAGQALPAYCTWTNASVSNCDSSFISASPNGSPSSLTVDSIIVNGNVNFSTAPGNIATYDKTLSITGNTVITVPTWWGVSVSGDNGNISINLGSGVLVAATNADPNSAIGVFARAEVSGDIDIQSAATVNAVGDAITATTNLGSVTVVNSGNVASSAGRGLYADGGYNNTSSSPAFVRISNQGTVASNQAGARAINYRGNILVENSGTITSVAKQGMIGWSQEGNVEVRNAGSITAQAGIGLQSWTDKGTNLIVNSGTVSAAQSAGLEVSTDDGTNRIVNSGTVTALIGVRSLAGNTTIENAGSIVAQGAGAKAIALNDGNHTLVLKSGSTITGGIDVAGGRLAIDTRADATLNGGIVGNAGLQKIGDATLTLGGVNTYSGATSLEQGKLVLTGSLASNVTIAHAGTLQVGDGSRAGDLTGATANNGTLVFAQPGNYDYKGALSGSGSLIKQGPGLLTLSGTYTYTGSTVVKGGSVQLAAALNPQTNLVVDRGAFDLGNRSQSVASLSGGGGSVAIGTGTLTINQAGNTAFGGALTGTGGFIKANGGRLNLTGSSAFSGTTLVSGGTLSVNGSLAGSAVTVGFGGTLGGNGTVGGMTVQGGGTAAPGNSIGTLNVAGNVAFGAGSVYQVEVDAAGQNDRIAATGNATLKGGTVKVLAAQGNYAPLTTYTILTANGGVNGRFGGVTSNFAFLSPSLRYDADAVQLMLSRNAVSFMDVAQTRNQLAVAGAAELLTMGNPVYDALLQLDAPNARVAFDGLSGEIHAASVGSLIEDSRLVRGAITDRLVQAQEPSSVTAAYAADLPGAAPGATVPVPARLAPRFGFWGQGFGSWGRSEATANNAKAERSTGGFLLGLDGGIGDAWRVGLAGGYSSGTVDLDARSSSASIDSYHAAIYAGAQYGAFALRLGGAYAWHDLETTRAVAFPNFSNALRADRQARTGQVFGELGYSLSLAGIALEPFAGLAYVNLDADRFGELGGAAALTGLGGSQDVTYGTLGLRFARSFALSETAELTARGMVGWRHAFDAVEPGASLAFATGTPFTITGAPIAQNALALEAELGIKVGANMSLGVSYDGQLAQDAQDHAVKGNFTLRF